VAFSGIKENPLGGGGLSGVNVGHDADVPFQFQHGHSLAEKGDKSNAWYIPGLRHNPRKTI
jgi:hypothetical protein